MSTLSDEGDEDYIAFSDIDGEELTLIWSQYGYFTHLTSNPFFIWKVTIWRNIFYVNSILERWFF